MGVLQMKGVVDHRGRVFSTLGGVMDGLFVSDGAVIPRSLGINPLLMISSFTERAVELHLKHDKKAGSPPPAVARRLPRPTNRANGIQFTERMKGMLRFQAEGARPEEDVEFDFVLTIEVKDIKAFVANPGLKNKVTGTVRCARLNADHGTRSLRVEHGGTWRMFVPNPQENCYNMFYDFVVVSVTGDRFVFHGEKTVRSDKRILKYLADPTEPYLDTTRLACTVHRQEASRANAPVRYDGPRPPPPAFHRFGRLCSRSPLICLARSDARPR